MRELIRCRSLKIEPNANRRGRKNEKENNYANAIWHEIFKFKQTEIA